MNPARSPRPPVRRVVPAGRYPSSYAPIRNESGMWRPLRLATGPRPPAAPRRFARKLSLRRSTSGTNAFSARTGVHVEGNAASMPPSRPLRYPPHGRTQGHDSGHDLSAAPVRSTRAPAARTPAVLLPAPTTPGRAGTPAARTRRRIRSVQRAHASEATASPAGDASPTPHRPDSPLRASRRHRGYAPIAQRHPSAPRRPPCRQGDAEEGPSGAFLRPRPYGRPVGVTGARKAPGSPPDRYLIVTFRVTIPPTCRYGPTTGHENQGGGCKNFPQGPGMAGVR